MPDTFQTKIQMLSMFIFLECAENNSDTLFFIRRLLFRYVASKFNFTFCYIDDLISFNNSKFGHYLTEIYPCKLQIELTRLSEVQSLSDITFMIDNDKFMIDIYDR